MTYSILMIDDNTDYLYLLEKAFQSANHQFTKAPTLKEAFYYLQKKKFDLVLLDVNLPDGSGVDFVSKIKELHPQLPIIMVSGRGETHTVVKAMQSGASDYVQKPITHGELFLKIKDHLSISNQKKIEQRIGTSGASGRVIGSSVKIKQLLKEVGRVANSDAPVLLQGESGTGKSLIAEVIHSFSQRKVHPFVVINCPAIPENLLESELFGHEKGAFTGAIKDKAGKFELAHRGTIFLDEIGDLSFDLQAKILRVLQGHEFERVGGLKTMQTDVRIIAATNKNLEAALEAKQFREDLFYRLNVLPIVVPSLRERKEDIPLLAQSFLEQIARKSKKHFEPLTEDVFRVLMDYEWPGNIRELQNVMERAVILASDNRITPVDIRLKPSKTNGLENSIDVHSDSLEDLEYRAFMHAFSKENGNISRVAKTLGVARGAVYRRLKKYNISRKRWELEN